MYEDNKGFEIICPFCFHKFPQEHTVFRAHTAYDRSQLEMSDDNDMGGLLGRSSAKKASKDPRELFLRFDAEGGKKQDSKLIDFWKNRGGSSGYATVDNTWDHPHIDPQSADFAEMICTEPQGADVPDDDGFVRDKDGFILRVLDKYTKSPRPMERLCPSCHNPMPLADYGKFPVKFISVVGITGAGKTVFLNQLLTPFSSEINGKDYAVTTSNLASIGESIHPRLPLPAATDDKIMRRPLAVTLHKQGGTVDDHMTLVFYDIAGENCVNVDGDPDTARAQATIGHFIAYCDAMIFLLDPEQIPSFSRGVAQISNIANVVSVLSDIRANMNKDAPNWETIPVAVCIAKSDKLDDSPHIPTGNPLLTHTSVAKAGFDREQHKQINDFLRTFLRNNAQNVVAPLNTFRRSAYFAVSAITCGVESRFEKYQNQYILDDTNERKFHSLRRWVEGWNARSVDNRAFYQKCPVRTQDGETIEISPNDNITRENAPSIVTEIRADSVDGVSIYLNLWDVASEVNLSGYPMAAPAPRRIGEPLRWILWRLDKIGPYFMADPIPAKKFLQSAKAYDQVLNQYYTEQYQKRLLFYGDLHEDEYV